jgi:hypothetical protein
VASVRQDKPDAPEGTKSLKQYLWNFSEKLSAYRGDNGLKAAGQAMPKKKNYPLVP